MAFCAMTLSSNICLHSNTHIYYFEQNAEKSVLKYCSIAHDWFAIHGFASNIKQSKLVFFIKIEEKKNPLP
jgi:hypothetical protein